MNSRLLLDRIQGRKKLFIHDSSIACPISSLENTTAIQSVFESLQNPAINFPLYFTFMQQPSQLDINFNKNEQEFLSKQILKDGIN